MASCDFSIAEKTDAREEEEAHTHVKYAYTKENNMAGEHKEGIYEKKKNGGCQGGRYYIPELPLLKRKKKTGREKRRGCISGCSAEDIVGIA